MVAQSNGVIINIWTLPNREGSGTQVGPVSIDFGNDYLSLWPEPYDYLVSHSGLEPLETIQRSFLTTYIAKRAPDCRQSYALDCLSAALAQGHGREIATLAHWRPPQHLFAWQGLTASARQVRVDRPFSLDPDERLFAVNPYEANIRIGLYSLDKGKLITAFKTTQKHPKDWHLLGCNGLAPVVASKFRGRSVLLARQWLEAGHLGKLLQHKTQPVWFAPTSSALCLDALVRDLIQAKSQEWRQYPETRAWHFLGETPLETLASRYHVPFVEQAKPRTFVSSLSPN